MGRRPVWGVWLLFVCVSLVSRSVAGCPPPLLWERNYAGAGSSGHAVVVDGSGNIVIVGEANLQWLIAKYDPAGSVVWTQEYNAGASSTDNLATGVGVDSLGNLIVVGRAQNRWLMLKMSSGGSLVWSRTYGVTAASTSADRVAVDRWDNIIVAGGENRSDLGHSVDWVVRKYNSAGGLLWSRTYNSPANDWDVATAVAVDAGGTVFCAGYQTRTDLGTGADWMIQAYGPSGNVLWTVTYNGAANGSDMASGIALDASGNPVVAGTEDRSDLGQGPNWLARKLSSSGVPLWSASFNADAYDQVSDVAVDPSGYAIVGGMGGDWRVLKYDGSGGVAWTTSYDVHAGLTYGVAGVAVDEAGNVYATGMYDPYVGGSTGAILRKYAAFGPASCFGGTVESGKVVVYPTPASGDLVTVAFPIESDAAEVEVKVYNPVLQPVYRGVWRNVTATEKQVTIHGLRQWSPGVYYVTVQVKLVDGQQKTFKYGKVVVKR